MSLQTATLGWKLISESNNLFLNIPYVGVVYIGMSEMQFHQGLLNTSKMALSPKEEKTGGKITYTDSNGHEVFSTAEVSRIICRVKFNGLASLIPQNLIYSVGKKKFLTNNRVDGYMLAIKDDEIYLKQEESVPAVDINSESLGVVKKTLTRNEAIQLGDIWHKVHAIRNVYNPAMFSLSPSEIAGLEQEYKSLVNKEQGLQSQKYALVKLLDRTITLNELRMRENSVKEDCDYAYSRYQGVVDDYKSDIQALMNCGKLYTQNNLVYLNKKSDKTHRETKYKQEAVYEYVEHVYEPEQILYEDYDQWEERRAKERSVSRTREFRGFKDVPYYVDIVDHDFRKAANIVSRFEKFRDNYINLKGSLDEIQSKIKEEENKIEAFMQTDEYKTGSAMIATIDAELTEVSSKVANLKQRIYG